MTKSRGLNAPRCRKTDRIEGGRPICQLHGLPMRRRGDGWRCVVDRGPKRHLEHERDYLAIIEKIDA